MAGGYDGNMDYGNGGLDHSADAGGYGGAAPAAGSAVFVSNLQWWTTDAELEQLVAAFGHVLSIRFIDDKACGKSRGMAIIEFAEAGAAEQCIAALNGRDINGRACRVAHQQQRGGAGGGSAAGRSTGSGLDSRAGGGAGRGGGPAAGRGRGGMSSATGADVMAAGGMGMMGPGGMMVMPGMMAPGMMGMAMPGMDMMSAGMMMAVPGMMPFGMPGMPGFKPPPPPGAPPPVKKE